jgi:DNA modification methylase
MGIRLYQGDNIAVLKTMAANSVDSVVTDPPYGLSFMNKHWDHQVPTLEFWQEVYRVLKPGGHVLSFSGTRTYHRMVVNIEDAGFEIRDQIGWMYGSGWPKSLDVSKAIDKAAGATDAAKQWQGWGTALKPAHEPICVARKPFAGTVAENVLEHGTGAINIDACRVGSDVVGWGGARGGSDDPSQSQGRNYRLGEGEARPVVGRWPANIIHDGSDELFGDHGDASRFFYCAKASKTDRAGSKHPTIKPIALMSYLVKLVTPPGGVVLDPFAGSGTTGQAAAENGFAAILIEMDPEYIEDIRNRLVLFIDEDTNQS